MLGNVSNTKNELNYNFSPTVDDDGNSWYRRGSVSGSSVREILNIRDHSELENSGSYSHSAIESHLDDAPTHLTEGNIDHSKIQNSGSKTHSEINTENWKSYSRMKRFISSESDTTFNL